MAPLLGARTIGKHPTTLESKQELKHLKQIQHHCVVSGWFSLLFNSPRSKLLGKNGQKKKRSETESNAREGRASELASGNHAEVIGTSMGFWEYLCSFQTSGVFLETLLPRMGLWHSKHLNTPYGLCSWLSFDVAKVTVVHHKSTPLHQWSMWRYQRRKHVSKGNTYFIIFHNCFQNIIFVFPFW